MNRAAAQMHVGLMLPSYAGNEELQIPALSVLASTLAPHVRLTVVPLRNPPGLTHTSNGGIDVVDVGGGGLKFRGLLRAVLTALRARHRSQPFDLLHGYWLYEPGFVATLAGRALGVPAIASIGGAELVDLPGLGYGGARSRRGRLLNSAVLRGARIATGGSGYVLDLARQFAPATASRLRYAPLPVDASTGLPPVNTETQSAGTNLLQVGAYLPVKGQDLSIRALASLLPNYPELRLTIIGEDPYGYKRRMAELARNLGIAQQVELLDRIPHRDLAAHHQASDMLLMPSRHESQGMVVLEAAALGLPTIGARVGVVGDLAPDAAVAVDIDDIGGLGRAIAALADDPGRRARLAAAARQTIADTYAARPATERWLKLYQEALDER